ncbi:DUF1990 family protein [Actinoplanes sp. NPDC051494]|uniref:DUF1990 family protein n=1 Tax=Actinoplanes sp. NPDC051494 TaxID=3363907 RepID=UPI0037ADEAEF
MGEFDLTYAEVGATRDAELPAGYGHVRLDVSIGAGREAFERAADGLMRWDMHRGAGFRFTGSPGVAAPGTVVALRLGVGPVGLRVPCKVVYVIQEPDRRGFAYGTLPGHPERGEEAFAVQLTGSGDVRAQIWAFSRPATLLARAGGPATRLVQAYFTKRYAQALRRIANPGG